MIQDPKAVDNLYEFQYLVEQQKKPIELSKKQSVVSKQDSGVKKVSLVKKAVKSQTNQLPKAFDY